MVRILESLAFVGVLRFGGGGGGGWVVEGLNVVLNLLTKPSVKGIEGLVRPPWVHVNSTKRAVWTTLGPSPADSGQAVCASFLSRLVIYGEHCRA